MWEEVLQSTGRPEVAGDRGPRGVACRRGLECTLGAGHGEERTLNMYCMSVTLDVSKLSGWLNPPAPCRITRRHVEGWQGRLLGACEGAWRRWRRSQRAQRNRLGTVEAQRLVER